MGSSGSKYVQCPLNCSPKKPVNRSMQSPYEPFGQFGQNYVQVSAEYAINNPIYEPTIVGYHIYQ
jgi:hypothetical protein